MDLSSDSPAAGGLRVYLGSGLKTGSRPFPPLISTHDVSFIFPPLSCQSVTNLESPVKIMLTTCLAQHLLLLLQALNQVHVKETLLRLARCSLCKVALRFFLPESHISANIFTVFPVLLMDLLGMKSDSWLNLAFWPSLSELLQHCCLALHARCSSHVIFGSSVSTFRLS